MSRTISFGASSGSTCVEFRESLSRDFAGPDPLLPYVSLPSATFAEFQRAIPPATQLTEANVLVGDVVTSHQHELEQLRAKFEKKLYERDQVYVSALAEITQTLRVHSLAIDELREQHPARR